MNVFNNNNKWADGGAVEGAPAARVPLQKVPPQHLPQDNPQDNPPDNKAALASIPATGSAEQTEQFLAEIDAIVEEMLALATEAPKAGTSGKAKTAAKTNECTPDVKALAVVLAAPVPNTASPSGAVDFGLADDKTPAEQRLQPSGGADTKTGVTRRTDAAPTLGKQTQERPARDNPGQHKPARDELEPVELEPVEPVPAESVLVEPVLSGPALSGPALSGPVLSQPVMDAPVITNRTEQRIAPVIDADTGPLKTVLRNEMPKGDGNPAAKRGGGGGGAGTPGGFHKRAEMPNFAQAYKNGLNAVRKNILVVMLFTLMTNILVLAIPIYLFQISDRVLTSRSLDTLIMLTIVVVGAVVLQSVLDAIRRFILMRTAVEVEAQLGAPILAAAARSSLGGSGRDYQVMGDLQQLRGFITSGTLLSILDAPLAPLFVLAVFLIHPHLGYIVVGAAVILLILAIVNQRMTARHFSEANGFLSRATLHVDSMSRNAQIINALAMIPEAVRIWGRDTANSLKAQVRAQDRNIIMASVSKLTRLLTQVTMLGWGAYLSIDGQMTGGMVIAASIIASRALTPIEGTIEGWNGFTQFRASIMRIRALLQTSPLNFERLMLPSPEGRLDVERVLFVPPPNKKVILNGITFSLLPGESLAVIGNSGAGKTTLGKMLVGSILPTSGSVRLDLMDLRNWDQRQFGESIGYLPQDVQLFPGTIKANIGRMREDASDSAIFEAAMLADVHELIASFPQGYETFVAADGSPLSGGQKQRIALARAFFGNPKLVVLDEPNSNLDSPGELALSKALVHARKQKITVVTITQRTSLLSHVDKILMLNNGTVAMFGTRNEVMKVLTGDTQKSQANLTGPHPTGAGVSAAKGTLSDPQHNDGRSS